MSFFIVCMIMRSHNLLSFNLGIGDFRKQDLKQNAFKLICQLCTTIHHAAQKPHTPTQKSKHRPKRQAAPKGTRTAPERHKWFKGTQ